MRSDPLKVMFPVGSVTSGKRDINVFCVKGY